MRRTTIFRSRVAHLTAVALALGLCATSLVAQQPPQAPQRAVQPAGPPPATHVVEKGETLWGLAQQFLGDPLLWPEIYRINTAVVEDPHWIYPGEELRLVPGLDAAATGVAAAPSAPAARGGITVAPTADDTAAGRAQPSAEANPAGGPTIFASRPVAGPSGASLQMRSDQAYRAVRQGEYFSAGFLTEGQELNAGKLLGNKATASISRLATTTSAQLFSNVAVTAPGGDSLKTGDLLLSYTMLREVEHYGHIVRPTGLLRVTSSGGADQNLSAQVIAVYQTIASGQSVIRVEPLPASSSTRPAPTDNGVVGEVIDLRDPHELVTTQDVLFVNRGSEEGVHRGDVFQVSRTTTATSGIGTIVQEEAKVLIVHTRPHTSTGIIIELLRPDIRPGATARQIRRMPS
jgi:LysM repeat protein